MNENKQQKTQIKSQHLCSPIFETQEDIRNRPFVFELNGLKERTPDQIPAVIQAGYLLRRQKTEKKANEEESKGSENRERIMEAKYYVLSSDHCIYEFLECDDYQERGRLEIQNARLKTLYYKDEKGQYIWGFIFMAKQKKIEFYCQEKDQHNQWMEALKSSVVLLDIKLELKINELLGKGMFAKVNLCERLPDCLGAGDQFALKTIAKDKIMESESHKAQLLSEIHVLRQLDHPQIIKLYQVFESTKYIHLLLPYLKGGELFHRIKQKNRYSEKDAAKVINDLLSALKYLAEKRVVHRDIKPENLILTAKDDDNDIKIADFGFATFLTDEEPVLYLQCGSPGYVAPEILREESYGCAADVFSAGAIMFVLLSGKQVFRSNDMNELIELNKNCTINFPESDWQNVSLEARDLCEKMLCKDQFCRITAEQAFNHDWFKLEFSDNQIIDPHKQWDYQDNTQVTGKNPFRSTTPVMGGRQVAQAAPQTPWLQAQPKTAKDSTPQMSYRVRIDVKSDSKFVAAKNQIPINRPQFLQKKKLQSSKESKESFKQKKSDSLIKKISDLRESKDEKAATSKQGQVSKIVGNVLNKQKLKAMQQDRSLNQISFNKLTQSDNQQTEKTHKAKSEIGDNSQKKKRLSLSIPQNVQNEESKEDEMSVFNNSSNQPSSNQPSSYQPNNIKKEHIQIIETEIQNISQNYNSNKLKYSQKLSESLKSSFQKSNSSKSQKNSQSCSSQKNSNSVSKPLSMFSKKNSRSIRSCNSHDYGDAYSEDYDHMDINYNFRHPDENIFNSKIQTGSPIQQISKGRLHENLLVSQQSSPQAKKQCTFNFINNDIYGEPSIKSAKFGKSSDNQTIQSNADVSKQSLPGLDLKHSSSKSLSDKYDQSIHKEFSHSVELNLQESVQKDDFDNSQIQKQFKNLQSEEIDQNQIRNEKQFEEAKQDKFDFSNLSQIDDMPIDYFKSQDNQILGGSEKKESKNKKMKYKISIPLLENQDEEESSEIKHIVASQKMSRKLSLNEIPSKERKQRVRLSSNQVDSSSSKRPPLNAKQEWLMYDQSLQPITEYSYEQSSIQESSVGVSLQNSPQNFGLTDQLNYNNSIIDFAQKEKQSSLVFRKSQKKSSRCVSRSGSCKALVRIIEDADEIEEQKEEKKEERKDIHFNQIVKNPSMERDSASPPSILQNYNFQKKDQGKNKTIKINSKPQKSSSSDDDSREDPQDNYQIANNGQRLFFPKVADYKKIPLQESNKQQQLAEQLLIDISLQKSLEEQLIFENFNKRQEHKQKSIEDSHEKMIKKHQDFIKNEKVSSKSIPDTLQQSNNQLELREKFQSLDNISVHQQSNQLIQQFSNSNSNQDNNLRKKGDLFYFEEDSLGQNEEAKIKNQQNQQNQQNNQQSSNDQFDQFEQLLIDSNHQLMEEIIVVQQNSREVELLGPTQKELIKKPGEQSIRFPSQKKLSQEEITILELSHNYRAASIEESLILQYVESGGSMPQLQNDDPSPPLKNKLNSPFNPGLQLMNHNSQLISEKRNLPCSIPSYNKIYENQSNDSERNKFGDSSRKIQFSRNVDIETLKRSNKQLGLKEPLQSPSQIFMPSSVIKANYQLTRHFEKMNREKILKDLEVKLAQVKQDLLQNNAKNVKLSRENSGSSSEKKQPAQNNNQESFGNHQSMMSSNSAAQGLIERESSGELLNQDLVQRVFLDRA